MKKIIIALLLIASFASAQDKQQKVWDLLLSNNRAEARKLFDKDLKKNKDSNPELLILDAIIEQQMGKLSFDKTFLQKFTALSDSHNYLYSIWYTPFVIGSVSSDGYDDLIYEKLDYISGLSAYNSDLFITYNKAVFDRKRRNYDSFVNNIDKLGSIPKWQFCGVFENMNGSGLDTEYEPEYYAKNDKLFNANSNGNVAWYIPGIPQKEGYHFYYNEREYGNGIIYAQTFIDSDSDRPVVLNFGSGGPVKIFLNDVEVYANEKARNTDLNAFLLKFNLKKGTNRLVIKSSTGGRDYFFAAIKDEKGNNVPGLTYSDVFKPYYKATLDEVSPEEIKPVYEVFLEQKIKSNPNNILYKILLFNTYFNNHKSEQAYDILEGIVEKYPNSSMLAVYQIAYYNSIEESAKATELENNLMAKDEDYYYSLVTKFSDGNWLQQANLNELARYREKAGKLQSPLYMILFDYIIALRKADIDGSFRKLEELSAATNNNEMYTAMFAPMYASVKNDKQKTISILEELLSRRDNPEVENTLISYYNSLGRKDDVDKLVMSKIKRYPYYNSMYDDAITIANNENRYNDALSYTDIALKNFPYSFTLMEKKGRAYNALNKTDEACKYLKESLLFNSGNSSLRKTLYDIAKIPDEISLVATKDIYSIIKQRRNSKAKSDYGVAILLDEYIVSILPEGGRKSKSVILYEVIAEKGIEELKEYELSADNVIKAEIVKPDGTIVPGEQGNGVVAFTNLKVNDVIYLEYENTDTGYGRFFKDFTLSCYLNNVYPSQQAIFGIIYPDDVKFAHNITNGNNPAKTRKLGEKNYTTWEAKDQLAMPLQESYAPRYDDCVKKVTVSSIKSWSDIANWYADLVKKNIKMDNVSLKLYNELFPKGTTGMADTEIARKIYNYIGENIAYSSLDFRQSGYVPQKPSRTITSRLGDCKDVSTLFVALADKAGLKANLVLVQTNDNGVKTLRLPSLGFNHCIVKVILDKKEHFLELTSSYLPFNAMPSSLYGANALVISFDKAENDKAALIQIPYTNALSNTRFTQTTVDVEEGVKTFTETATFSGTAKSYYNELFSDVTSTDVRKKELEDVYNRSLNKTITFGEAKALTTERFSPDIKFMTKFSIAEKLQSVGSMKIIQVPFVHKVYTRDIINGDKRNYDINYISYEDAQNYRTEITINIPQGKKFTEIPQNRDISYKRHHYKLSYEPVGSNALKVVRTADVSWDDITTIEYPEFRKFVEEVIAAEEEIIGFK